MLRRKLTIAFWLAGILLPCLATAQDYPGVVERILRDGKYSVNGKYLEFRDGETRQYAVVTVSDDYQDIVLKFIEERWSKSGERDVIEQWVIQVQPTMQAHHALIVENHSIIVDIRQFSPLGAEDVARRIAEKVTGNGPPKPAS